ncbi:MAG TPA: quinate 5-dehydrogenase [Clostridiales bacterium]|nr:quinate 5-dehydrogenase [Clostridiales bacterium]
MKRVVSVSIGSSARDHSVELEALGQKILVQRIGTDGDINKAIEIIRSLDGKIDAFGMGGIDLYVYSSTKKRYVIKAALPIYKAAVKTPIVDGSGLKNLMEKRVIYYACHNCGIDIKASKVLLVCAMDRYGMAEAFEELGADVVYGDAMFALGIPLPVKTMRTIKNLASIFMPVVSRLPIEMLYPTGKYQSRQQNKSIFHKYYYDADIIAGDFLYIKKHMPQRLNGKVIITNTVTLDDINTLKERGVRMLITSTPNIKGRSFGTNVIEAILISLLGKMPHQATQRHYDMLLKKVGFGHRVEYLQ